MKTRAISVFTLLLSLILLSACNQYNVQKKVNRLEETITSYGVALRWAEHQTLYSYYVSPNGTQPPADLDRLKEISVTGHQVLEKTINEDHTEAEVKMLVKYYIKTEGTLKELKMNQAWWFNEPNSQWFIDGEFPKF